MNSVERMVPSYEEENLLWVFGGGMNRC
jgi:hypothetical protein